MCLYTGNQEAGPARFSPVSEVLPEGSPTESVLTAAEAESEINSGVVKSKQSSKEAYISQVCHQLIQDLNVDSIPGNAVRL